MIRQDLFLHSQPDRLSDQETDMMKEIFKNFMADWISTPEDMRPAFLTFMATVCIKFMTETFGKEHTAGFLGDAVTELKTGQGENPARH